jgi:hypothetical protein
MRSEIVSTQSLIENISKFSAEGFLYTKIGIIDEKDRVLISYDEYNAEPIDKFTWTLSCSEVEDILRDLNTQIQSPTMKECVNAINYYIQNDAFINLEN